ncbi:MAG: hypothetical protein R6V73_09585 [Anaerolineales bacterium]|jgi:hypothetical protein
MADVTALVPEEQRQGLEALTNSCNERLEKAGAQGAEQSFGLGCALGGLPLVGGVLMLYVLGVFSFILAFITFVMGALVLLGITALISFSAKKRSIAEIYRTEIGPEIQAYLNNHHIEEEQLNRFVDDTLPVGAPLRIFHFISLPEDINSSQE